jgi:hypothetical protein
MTTRVPAVLVNNVQLTTSYATYYTAPATGIVTFSAFDLNNTTATPQTVNISLVPSGGSQAGTNEIRTEVSVAAKTAVTVNLAGHHMSGGMTLQMKASAATSITPEVSGYVTA